MNSNTFKNLSWRSLMMGLLMLFSTPSFAFDLGDFLELVDAVQGRDRIDRPGRPGRPDRPGRGQIFCTASDNGWEEHSRGHLSCRECLREHGSCTETCEERIDMMQCQYDGRARDGRFATFTGRGEDRREAEMDAENQCWRAGYRDCRYVRCDWVQERGRSIRRDCGRR
ncbi:MAG: hypothetical protein AB7N80_02385 [Bdellovibrionales bacterium]